MAFKAGQSGNRAGRPRGLKDRRTLFRDMVDPFCSQLVQKAVDMALTGNEPMLRLLLDRILPAKPKEEPINIRLQHDSQLEKTKAVFLALSKGKVSPSEATELLKAVVMECKIYEAEDTKLRLEKLEQTVSLERNSFA